MTTPTSEQRERAEREILRLYPARNEMLAHHMVSERVRVLQLQEEVERLKVVMKLSDDGYELSILRLFDEVEQLLIEIDEMSPAGKKRSKLYGGTTETTT